jgi:hypothetical protein
VAARRFFVSGPWQTAPVSTAATPPLICSARGCRAPATWALHWNNPRLHTEERRKTWLACDEHRGSLSGFLEARGFLRSVQPLGAGA